MEIRGIHIHIHKILQLQAKLQATYIGKLHDYSEFNQILSLGITICYKAALILLSLSAIKNLLSTSSLRTRPPHKRHKNHCNSHHGKHIQTLFLPISPIVHSLTLAVSNVIPSFLRYSTNRLGNVDQRNYAAPS